MPIVLQSRSHGFSLIELLVVMSLVSLLMAMLLPGLQAARVASQRTQTLSNMRQLTLAAHAYANDFKDTIPYAKMAQWSTLYQTWHLHNNRHWPRRLHVEGRYVTSHRIFWSPARPRPFAGETPPDGSGGYAAPHYSANIAAMTLEHQHRNWLAGLFPDATKRAIPLRLSEAGTPPHATFLLLSETWDMTELTGVGVADTASTTGGRYNSTTPGGLYNYRGALPRSYVDGHVRAGGRVTGGYISITGSSYPARPHPDELGWDINEPGTPNGNLVGGPYGGWWVNQHIWVGERSSPRYLHWREDPWFIYGP
jgi:prepilin-type N-terminal cleavage/methylation domain-containing protein